MSAISTSTQSSLRSVSLGSVFKAALIGGGIAAIGNLVLWLLANVLNIALTVLAGPPGPNAPVMSIAAPMVIIFSLLPALIGGLLYFVFTRVSARGATIFTVLAVVIVLLSLIPILGQPLTPPGMVVLILMHIVAAAAITWALTMRSQPS